MSGDAPTPNEPMSPVERRRLGISPAAPYPPVDLAPVPGCELCAWWASRRDNAHRGIGTTTAMDCARQIAAHPHRRAGDAT
ncbi:hypothetical protein ACIQVO_25565 [Streptomyces sp. NPDC101062]|uniref:hypothetical protein n=1 Tax=unclassified Streptomyces TaxID=2593676 RepID=UPI002E78C774|nr:hypothetical protein [Streptomyces sp. JV176]MEE1803769.1 hypothetical protein [Streptomyces sp. JV176]